MGEEGTPDRAAGWIHIFERADRLPVRRVELALYHADRTLIASTGAPVHYLVGTPKGRLSKFEKKLLTLPWQAVRPSVDVKLLSHDSEFYILARSHPRTLKERAMRRRRLKKLWRRLHELQQQSLTRDELLLKLGAAKKEAGRACHLVDIALMFVTGPHREGESRIL